MRSPCARASTIESKMALIITSESLRERCGNLLFTSSIKSRFVITISLATQQRFLCLTSPFSLLEQRGRPFVSEPTSLRVGETPSDRCEKQLFPPSLLLGTRIIDSRILLYPHPLGGEFDGIIQRTKLIH